jgi:hypothetical protein
MKALLKNMRTGLYYKWAKSWSSQPDGALDFETFERARRFALMTEMEQVSVVLSCEQSGKEVALPVGGGYW